MSTDGWNDQKDIFLNGLDALIKGIKKPDLVKREELDTAQAKSKRLLDLITAKDGEVGTLKEQIEALKKLKDKEQVAEVARKYSKSDEEFERLRSLAAKALGKLKTATCAALFWELRGDVFRPQTRDDYENIHAAEADKEIYEAGGCYRPNGERILVQNAESAVRELKNFLHNLKDENFFKIFEEEHEYPADLDVQKLWQNQLCGF
jgi:hypothetical protein